MPRIHISANNYVTESMGVVSVFIDEILPINLDVTAQVFFVGGGYEYQVITSGSTFKSPDVSIESVKFINDNAVGVDIEYHTSSLLIYDERKVIGDVNALTRFDNLTNDGNQYFFGQVIVASVGNYSQLAIHNPPASGKSVYITSAEMSAFGESMAIRKMTGTVGLADIVTVSNKDGSLPNGSTRVMFALTAAQLGALVAAVPTSTTGQPTNRDFKNAPLKINPDDTYIFSPGAQNVKNSLWVEIQEGELV